MDNIPIRYELEPFDLAGHRLRVRMTVEHPTPEGQSLTMPAWIPGSYLIRDFSRQIETLRASTQGRSLRVEKTDNHTWQAEPCDGPLEVVYTVYAWDLSVRGAHVDQTHAFFNGTCVFLRPQGQADAPSLVKLIAPESKSDWKVYTSLPRAQGIAGAARPHGFGWYAADNYDTLIDHPVEMGTPQVARFEAHGAVHELVFTGLIPHLDLPRIVADVRRICETQISFFEPRTRRAPFLDSSEHYTFLVTVTGDGYGGLEHRASTALIATRKDLPVRGQRGQGRGYRQFLGLVSHEYFHTWHVKRIKPAAFAPYALDRPNLTSLLWVFEGFTSYYDDLMLLRSGVIDQAAYLSLLARAISQLAQNPGRHKQSVAESSFDAWTRYYKMDENSPNAIVSYYGKGSLIALGLDLTIRQRSQGRHSLDDVMRLLWQRYGRNFYRGKPEGLPEDVMPAIIRQATGVDVRRFITRHVTGHADVPLAALLAEDGIDLRWRALVNIPTIQARTRVQQGSVSLATVYEHGAAHKAGLSAGDVLVAIDGLRVDAAQGLDILLAQYQAGDKIRVHAFRRDELMECELRLAAPEQLECELVPFTNTKTA